MSGEEHLKYLSLGNQDGLALKDQGIGWVALRLQGARVAALRWWALPTETSLSSVIETVDEAVGKSGVSHLPLRLGYVVSHPAPLHSLPGTIVDGIAVARVPVPGLTDTARVEDNAFVR